MNYRVDPRDMRALRSSGAGRLLFLLDQELQQGLPLRQLIFPGERVRVPPTRPRTDAQEPPRTCGRAQATLRTPATCGEDNLTNSPR
eukprot:6058921-Pyramimonas_sp.AAC.1